MLQVREKMAEVQQLKIHSWRDRPGGPSRGSVLGGPSWWVRPGGSVHVKLQTVAEEALEILP